MAEDGADDEGDELLGEVVGAVVVGAAGDAHGHLEGVAVGHHDEVGACLAGAVGRVGAERCLLSEVALGPQ